MLSFIIAMVCMLLFVGAIFVWNENSFASLLLAIICFGGSYGCITNPTLKQQREAEQKEEDARQEKCRAPQLVSRVNGIELWSYSEWCGAKPVYFSKSGTTTEKCHRSGKSTVCENVYVPNN